MKTERTAQSDKYGPATYDNADLRTYKPVVVEARDKKLVEMTLCEERNEDRREPFVWVKTVA